MSKKYQKELDHIREDDFDITEYEEHFIRNPDFGPYESDDMFDTYHGFDFFTIEYILQSIEEFKALTKQCGLSDEDYQKIESGIAAFTQSSTVPKKETAILYKSLLRAFPDIIHHKFHKEEEEVTQLFQGQYFETFERFDIFSIEEEDLISESAIEIYYDCSNAISIKRLREWVKYSIEKDGDSAWAGNVDQIYVYRGINNKSYYKRLKRTQKDFLSLYKNLDEDFPFFEKNLLTSYTLSPNLAEQFMVGNPRQKSERRVLVEGYTEIIEDRVFSSFLVSPNFRDAQLEFICLPDQKDLKIRTNFDNEVYASFVIYE